MYLVGFNFEEWVQGYDWVYGHTLLVKADTFEEACDRIRNDTRFYHACSFENRTL